jgi:predicted GNAT family acetyltransferase
MTIATLFTPKGDVTIRKAGLADTTSLSELRMEALRDNPTVFGSSFDARENCTPEWAFRVLGADPQESSIFVAGNKQELTGMAAIRRFSGQKIRHSATIGSVYIQPDWRGFGIVDALFQACFEWARAQQIVIIKLAVVTTNPAALKAYQRLGFTVYGSDPKVILHAGVFYDEYLMAREI